MTFAEFRTYKLARIRAHLERARDRRLAGRHDLAVWYQHLAGVARQSLLRG